MFKRQALDRTNRRESVYSTRVASINGSGRNSNTSTDSRNQNVRLNGSLTYRSRSGSQRRNQEVSFEEKFRQHMERRLGLQQLDNVKINPRKNSKSVRRVKKKTVEIDNLQKNIENDKQFKNASKKGGVDYMNLKVHMKNLQTTAFTNMDNLSKGLNALRNMGEVLKKNGNSRSKSPNIGEMSQKHKNLEKKSITRNYVINNYLNPEILSKKETKNYPKNSNLKIVNNVYLNESKKFLNSGRLLPTSRRCSTSPRTTVTERSFGQNSGPRTITCEGQ